MNDFKRLFPRLKNNSGIILVLVLWIVVILSLLAFGLSRKTSIDLALTKYMVGQVKAKYIALAGLIYALNQVKQDSQDETTRFLDTLYQCGISLKDKTTEDIFKHIPIGEGYFTVSYRSPKASSQDNVIYYGLQDEERRININALNEESYLVFKQLIILLGVDEDKAETIASSTVDWHDEDSAVTHDPAGAEDSYYMRLSKPYHCKNSPFDSIEELLLVKGMTTEIFDKIKDYVTIFPKKGNLLINFDTASEIILRSLARGTVIPGSTTSLEDADSLVKKIISYRKGEDGQEMTEDDQIVDMNKMGISVDKEYVVLVMLSKYKTNMSKFLRVHITGVDDSTLIQANIEAIVQRDNLSTVYWYRD